MHLIELDGIRLEVNEEGFLASAEEWNDAAAVVLARAEEGLEALTEDHWTVIRFIRGHWLETGMAPMVRKICQASGLTLRSIYELFPSGPAKGACKLAGLPKPDGCV